MKKFLRVLALVMCAMLLFSLVACNGPKTISASKAKRLIDKYGIPQAQLTLNFTSNGKKMKYVITYDLLMDKTPTTVVNFINLVENKFYDNVIFQTYNSSQNFYRAAGYSYREDSEGKSKVVENVSGITIPGEFESNLYSEPKGGYADFSMFSLAMYHENTADKFDSANGELIFSTGDSVTLNASNYAVFAKMVSLSVYTGDDETPQTYTGKISEWALTALTKINSASSCNVTTAEGDSKSVSLIHSSNIPRLVFSIEMLGGEWSSKLPKVN